MKHRIIQTVVLALGLCAFTGATLAADAQPQKAKPASTAAVDKKADRKADKAAKKADTKVVRKPMPQPVLVDINSASREELKKLPGIGDAEADRIVAGRPFLTKAQLQTDNIVSAMAYQGLRERIVARQKDAKFGKPAGK